MHVHVLRTRLNELPNHSSNDPRPPQRRVKYERYFVPLLHRIRLRVDRDDAVVEGGGGGGGEGLFNLGVKSLSDHQTMLAFCL